MIGYVNWADPAIYLYLTSKEREILEKKGIKFDSVNLEH